MSTFAPTDLGTALTSGLPTVLAYIGAAVAAGIVGTLTFVGIKKGVSWGLMLLRGYHREYGMWVHKDAGM